MMDMKTLNRKNLDDFLRKLISRNSDKILVLEGYGMHSITDTDGSYKFEGCLMSSAMFNKILSNSPKHDDFIFLSKALPTRAEVIRRIMNLLHNANVNPFSNEQEFLQILETEHENDIFYSGYLL